MKILKKLIFPVVEAVVIFLGIFFLRKNQTHHLIDAFTITGFLLFLQGLSFWIGNEGVFNSVTWGFGKLVDMFRKVPKNNLKYFEYVQMKNEKDKTELWPSLSVGGLFLVV